MNNTVYTSKAKNYQYFSKKRSATKHSPPSNVNYMEFNRNLLFEYSLFDCKTSIYQKKWNMIQNYENRRSVKKCPQNAGSNIIKYTVIVLITLESDLWRSLMWHIQ